MPVRSVLLFLFALCLVGSTKTAYGKKPSINGKSWLPLGINFGYTWGDSKIKGESQDVGFLGVEISYAVTFEPSNWVGVYMDIVHLFDDNSNRFSFGPEFGFGGFGVEGGYVAELGESNDHGIQGRLLFYWVAFGVYIRGGSLWNNDDNGLSRSFGEFGMLLKMPLPLFPL